jgi:hypothetical protein
MIDELCTAIIEGAKASRYAKDPQHPDQPGTLTRFFASLCELHPAGFMSLLGVILEREVEPTVTDVSDAPKPGRWYQ